MRSFYSVLCLLSLLCLPVMAQNLTVTPNSAAEGSSVTVRYTEAGDADPLERWDTIFIDLGDGTSVGYTNTLQSVITITHRYPDNRPGGGAYALQAYEMDSYGNEYLSSATANIANVPPDFSLPTSFTLTNGQSFQYSGAFTDSGTDTWTAIIDYGDESSATVALGSSRSFALNHNYSGPGSYTLAVTIRDDDGGQNTRTATVTVQPVQPVPEPVLSIYTFAGLVIDGQTGARYAIQKTDSLQSSNWTTITNLTLTNNPQLWIDLNSTNSPNRFYRAVLGTP